jgi:hypothetical protein
MKEIIKGRVFLIHEIIKGRTLLIEEIKGGVRGTVGSLT